MPKRTRIKINVGVPKPYPLALEFRRAIVTATGTSQEFGDDFFVHADAVVHAGNNFMAAFV